MAEEANEMQPWIVAVCAGASATAVAAAGVVYLAGPDLWELEAASDAPELGRALGVPAGPGLLTGSGSSITAPSPPAVANPSFDVVRVEPTGEAVIAGRAAPNAKVELRDRERVLAEATADGAGQFVILPDALAPGSHSLTLARAGADASARSSAISVNVAAPPDKAVPAAPAASADGGAGPKSIGVKSVEFGPGGGFVIKGAASPNALVRLYLSGAFVGDAKTGADGLWSLTIRHGMTPGPYAVRADEINSADASVVARAEAPFDYPRSSPDGARNQPVRSSPADVVVESVQTAHVEAGNTLWGLSQTFYGDGSRYQLIFAANTGQIRNPNLIYPGQTFVVPRGEPKP